MHLVTAIEKAIGCFKAEESYTEEDGSIMYTGVYRAAQQALVDIDPDKLRWLRHEAETFGLQDTDLINWDQQDVYKLNLDIVSTQIACHMKRVEPEIEYEEKRRAKAWSLLDRPA